MVPVRPAAVPTPDAAQRPDIARQAAQRAFFQAALSGQAPVAAPAAPPTPAVYAQPVQRIPDPGAEPPTRILRPGSLLDIRV